MTTPNQIRDHFAREAERYPAPAGMRAGVTARAEALAGHGARQNAPWLLGAVAALLALAIVVGLIAAGNLRRNQSVPANATPTVLFHDSLNARAAGRPSLPAIYPATPHIARYTLAATLPPSPAEGIAYAIDPSHGPSAEAVGKAFGIATKPQLTSGQYVYPPKYLLQYFPDTGTIEYSRPTISTQLDEPGYFPRPITDQASAIAMAGDFLVAHGLYTRSELATMQASATHLTYPHNLPTWSLQFRRTLGGVPTTGMAWLQAEDGGRINSLVVGRSPIGGSESATLIDAAAAWQEISLGHWYGMTGTLNNGPTAVPTFQANLVELCYLEGYGQWLVPMWCFTDSTTEGPDFPVSLFYPALTPGTFDWTVPNRNS